MPAVRTKVLVPAKWSALEKSHDISALESGAIEPCIFEAGALVP